MEKKSQTNLPNIILPGEPAIQKAVSKIKTKFPNFFDKVKEIRIAPGGSGYAYVTNAPDKAGVIFLDLNKIKTKLTSEMGGASKEDLENALVKALYETIAHEQGHIADDLKGGEFPAEQKAREVSNIIDPPSLKNACELFYKLASLPVINKSPKCEECGGQCCKFVPGIYSPKQFGNSPEEIKKNLIKNQENLAIRYFTLSESDKEDEDIKKHPNIIKALKKSPGYLDICMILPRRKKYPRDSACNHLSPGGCELSQEDRPAECSALDPETCGYKSEEDIPVNNMLYFVNEWAPYQDIIKQLDIPIEW